MKLLVGARNSALSRAQSYELTRALKNVEPKLEIEYRFRESVGDLQREKPFSKFAERGIFTGDFTRSLAAGEIDIALHCWKDLPTAENKDTIVAATLPRADCRDLVIFPRDRILAEKKNPAAVLKILTSAPRREFNLRDFFSWALPLSNVSVEFEAVRGNVDTRIQKLLSGSAHGLIVAKAALDRLLLSTEDDLAGVRKEIAEALSQSLIMILPPSVSPAAAAQGALAIEVARDRKDLQALLAKINDKAAFAAVLKERRILSFYGGGCQQKIGVTVIERPYGEVKYLRGSTEDGQLLNDIALSASTSTFPKAQSIEKIWPSEEGPELFDREELELDLPVDSVSDGYWIARADALPRTVSFSWDKPVWTAGVTTWRKLAARGVWVTGSADGLGENEDPRLSAVLPRLKRWVKFTHADATQDKHDVVSTYRLIPRAKIPALDSFTHFFWKSGSALALALKNFPAIGECWHGCGPGNTFSTAKSLLQSSERLRVFLSFEDFLTEVTP